MVSTGTARLTSQDMKIAVIETAGSQYLVKTGDKIKIPAMMGAVGSEIRFDRVLLSSDGKNVELGKPHISGAAVVGKIVKSGRSKKTLVLKYHNKTRYRRKHGHRQDYVEVEITVV